MASFPVAAADLSHTSLDRRKRGQGLSGQTTKKNIASLLNEKKIADHHVETSLEML